MLGCGNVGSLIVEAVREGILDAEIGALFDLDQQKARELAGLCGNPSLAITSFKGFLAEGLDLVVEAASIEAVEQHAEEILASGKDLVVLSVGALIDRRVRNRLARVAAENGSKLIIPSGAVGGLDLLKAAAIEGIEEIELTTTKNPESLPGEGPDERRKIFDGSAMEALELFPRNINVAAALAIAADADLRVRIISDPGAERNRHEVRARGAFGDMTLVVSNVPSPKNPKTSYLAALSVIRTIQGVDQPLVIGT